MPKEFPTHVEGINPILRVEDLSVSLRYYVDVLGFSLGWRWPEDGSPPEEGRLATAYVFRDDFELLIQERAAPIHAVEIVVGMPSRDAVDAIDEEYTTAGARVLEHPAQRDWGTYEMAVTDPDGHLLRILR